MAEPTKTITISGLKLKLKSITIDDNIIWSKNTGRVASGEMEGDIVARKAKLIVILAPMDDEETANFSAAIDSAFFPIEYRNPKTGQNCEKTFYVGTPTYPVYSYADGLPRYVGVAANFIEK